MLKNVYSPLSGGVLQERVMEIISNNLANANTVAFKEEELAFKAEEANPWPSYASPLPPAPFRLHMEELLPLHGNEMSYVTLSDIKTSHTQGGVSHTGRSEDLALQGDGFFQVMTPFGVRYTRSGDFRITQDGSLVTKEGHPVLGMRGSPITGVQADDLKVLASGEVYHGKQFVDKIQCVSFADLSLLERLGNQLWIHNGPMENITNSKAELMQGFLENSNVNPMKNMANLIVAHRSYEALQKTVKSQDETMQNANKISDVG